MKIDLKSKCNEILRDVGIVTNTHAHKQQLYKRFDFMIFHMHVVFICVHIYVHAHVYVHACMNTCGSEISSVCSCSSGNPLTS